MVNIAADRAIMTYTIRNEMRTRSKSKWRHDLRVQLAANQIWNEIGIHGAEQLNRGNLNVEWRWEFVSLRGVFCRIRKATLKDVKRRKIKRN